MSNLGLTPDEIISIMFVLDFILVLTSSHLLSKDHRGNSLLTFSPLRYFRLPCNNLLYNTRLNPTLPPRSDCLWRSSISLAWDDIHLEEKILQCHHVVPLHSIWHDCLFLLAGSGLLQYFHDGRGKWYVFHPESCFLEWPGFIGMSLYVNNTHSNWLLISAVKAPISPFTLLT